MGYLPSQFMQEIVYQQDFSKGRGICCCLLLVAAYYLLICTGCMRGDRCLGSHLNSLPIVIISILRETSWPRPTAFFISVFKTTKLLNFNIDLKIWDISMEESFSKVSFQHPFFMLNFQGLFPVEHSQVQRFVGKRLQMRPFLHHPKIYSLFLQLAMFWFLMTSSDGQLEKNWSAFRLQIWVRDGLLQMFYKDVQVEMYALNTPTWNKKMVSMIREKMFCKTWDVKTKQQLEQHKNTSFCGALGNQTHVWNEICECTVELIAVEFEISGGSPFFIFQKVVYIENLPSFKVFQVVQTGYSLTHLMSNMVWTLRSEPW